MRVNDSGVGFVHFNVVGAHINHESHFLIALLQTLCHSSLKKCTISQIIILSQMIDG